LKSNSETTDVPNKKNKKKVPSSYGKIKWFNIDWQKATVQVKQRQIEIAVA
jgi:hypothetical protein